MGCLSENTIQELVGGVLPGAARAQAHLHIETCAACRLLVIELARDGDLEGIPPPDERPPDGVFTGALHTVVNTEPPADRSGLATQIGLYEIIRLLGRGGMGEVHLARDLRLGRLVAVKLLATRDPDLELRFLAEARATARCHHENIVVIHEVGTHMGRPYMVLEYLEGQTLRQWLRDQAATAGRPARVPPARAVELMLPVVRALAYAHDQGIVHRDLKPENVMLTRIGGTKVLDFGLAKLIASRPDPGSADREPGLVADSSSLVGTLPYMSPSR